MRNFALSLLLAFTAAANSAAGGLAPRTPDLDQFLADIPSQPAPSVPLPARAAYLSQASGLSGERLFQFLHQATEFSLPKGGTAYLNAKKYMFSVADNTGCGGRPGVVAFYSQVCVPGASEHGEDYREQGDSNGDGYVDSDGMNAEHSWPQGFFNGELPMRADLHHIFPTFIKPNNTRGSSPFGVAGRAEYSTSSGSRFDGSVFEPADAVKGDIARALLYFVVRYYDRDIRDGMNYRDFWTSRVPLLLQWDRQDPPDAAERRRNDLIERYQGNRNPFVDDTSLAPRVGAAAFQSH